MHDGPHQGNDVHFSVSPTRRGQCRQCSCRLAHQLPRLERPYLWASAAMPRPMTDLEILLEDVIYCSAYHPV